MNMYLAVIALFTASYVNAQAAQPAPAAQPAQAAPTAAAPQPKVPTGPTQPTAPAQPQVAPVQPQVTPPQPLESTADYAGSPAADGTNLYQIELLTLRTQVAIMNMLDEVRKLNAASAQNRTGIVQANQRLAALQAQLAGLMNRGQTTAQPQTPQQAQVIAQQRAQAAAQQRAQAAAQQQAQQVARQQAFARQQQQAAAAQVQRPTVPPALQRPANAQSRPLPTLPNQAQQAAQAR